MLSEKIGLSKLARRSLGLGGENLDMLILPAIILLVGLGAFALGRLSALEGQQPELKILQNAEAENTLSP